MGDADTVDGLHANSFVRKWYGVYGSANKFLSFDTSKEKGWIKLEVAESSNGVSGAYGIYIISWPYVGEGNVNPTVKCIYSTTKAYITALTAVQTDTTKFDLYFKFLGAAAYPTYTIYASATTSDLNYTVTAVTDIPTDNTYTSSLASLQLTASSCTGNSATATSATTASKLQASKSFWGNNFDGTQDINGTITFPSIGDKATSNKISWNGSTEGADIYYETTAADQGNLVLNVRDDANAYI
jgi:hypothetical protein